MESRVQATFITLKWVDYFIMEFPVKEVLGQMGCGMLLTTNTQHKLSTLSMFLSPLISLPSHECPFLSSSPIPPGVQYI